MKHEERQLAMFKDKRDGAIKSWERVYENYQIGQASIESLVAAMEICNTTERAFLESKWKSRVPGQKK